MRRIFYHDHRHWTFQPTPLDPSDPDDLVVVHRSTVEERRPWVVHSNHPVRYKTKRAAMAAARRITRRYERANRSTLLGEAVNRYVDRVLALSNEQKVRSANQTAAIRNLWRDFSHPMVFQLDRNSPLRYGMLDWLRERGARLHTGVPFAYRRFSRCRPVYVFGDVADCPSQDVAFEFKMRWL